MKLEGLKVRDLAAFSSEADMSKAGRGRSS